MARELPYLPTYKNVDELFRKIGSAKQPDSFTTRFLTDTIGLKSTGDRPLITLLKTLGFLDSSGRPTAEYGALKNPAESRRAIARATRRAFEPLFAANENAHQLNPSDLRGLVAQVAGTDSSVTQKICGTFNALVRIADFAQQEPVDDSGDAPVSRDPEPPRASELKPPEERKPFAALRPDFHYNIQVHLPANASEETYLSIFNALRKSFS